MAVAGAPRIVTQTTTNLRVSNETETGFVQQASTGLTPATIDGEVIVVLSDRIIVRNIAGSNTTVMLYDLDLNLIDSYPCPGGVIFTFAFNPLDSLILAFAKVGPSASVAIALNADRTDLSGATMPSGLPAGTEANQILRAAISPDGQTMVVTRSGLSRTFYRRLSATTWQQQIPPTGIPGAMGGDVLAWSRDSQFVFIETGNTIVVVSNVGGDFTYLSQITTQPGQSVHRVAMSPDNVFMAASTSEDDGGLTVYRTRLFKRSGDDFLPIASIDNFGSTLAWNELGNQLYDAGTRRAFRRTPNTNVFVELSGFMSNIAAGVIESATSPHIAFPTGAAMFYDNVFYDIITGTQSLAGLKLALLDANYVFNTADASAATILANYEVAGAHWPQGGKDVMNVRFEPYGTQGAYLDADDIEQMIYEGSITARYALVYDAADRPVAFVDFQQEITAELNSKFTLKMGDFGFVLISP